MADAGIPSRNEANRAAQLDDTLARARAARVAALSRSAPLGEIPRDRADRTTLETTQSQEEDAEQTPPAPAPGILSRASRLVQAQRQAQNQPQQQQDDDDEEFADRDLANDQVDRSAWAAVLTGVGFLWFFLWANVKLIVGYILGKGQNRIVSPPNWRFANIPLPDISATMAILFIDIFVLVIVVPLALVQLVMIGVLAYAAVNPLGAASLVQTMFGQLSTVILQLIGRTL